MQLLCELQDVYSQHKYYFGVVDIPFHVTFTADADIRRQRITKVLIHYRDQFQQILDDLVQDGII